MIYEKYPEIVHETETAYIATIWTGPNYYIGWFEKSEIDAYMEYAAECGVSVSLDQAIARTSVGEMNFMCKPRIIARMCCRHGSINSYPSMRRVNHGH